MLSPRSISFFTVIPVSMSSFPRRRESSFVGQAPACHDDEYLFSAGRSLPYKIVAPISDGDNDVEVVEPNLVVFSFGGSSFQNGNN